MTPSLGVFPSCHFLHKRGINSRRKPCVGLVTSSQAAWSMFPGSAADEPRCQNLVLTLSLLFQVQSRSTNMSGLGDSSTDPANPDSRKRKGSPCDTAQRYVRCSPSVPAVATLSFPPRRSVPSARADGAAFQPLGNVHTSHQNFALLLAVAAVEDGARWKCGSPSAPLVVRWQMMI